MIDSDINHLDPNFKVKVQLFLDEAKSKGFHIKIFEGKRSYARQLELYNQGRTTPGKIVTWTMKSKHLTGQATDIVFIENGQPSWNGNYDALIEIAKKYGINNLSPIEKSHFQENGQPLNLNQILMGFYENIYKQENPNGGKKIKSPEGAIEKIVNKDGTINIKELVYFICIGLERSK